MRLKNTLFCKTVLSKKGFSLIELVTFIVVGGIILPASIIAFTNAMGNFMTPDYQTKARFYAEQRMEEVTRLSYDTISCPAQDSPEGYTRTCSINYAKYISATNTIETSATDDMPNYRIIKVSVTPPEGPAYEVSTIVTKRPKS